MKKDFIYHNVFIIFLVFFSLENAQAQLGFCQGNSGDPIFTETFGTGTNYGPILPTGTTSYTFVGFNGPQDGEYTIGRNTFAYGWDLPNDHTIGDTNGKALIVNASFISGEFYSRTVSGLCESTTYEFSSWLINILPSTGCGGNGIPINVKFQITNLSGVEIASGNTGNIFGSTTPNWQQFGLVFKTDPGENAVILKMINNGAGGCGNDLAIDDIVFKSCGDFIDVTNTSGSSYTTLCSGETPYSTTFTATPDNTVFNNHFYQWQESTDGTTWTDIAGETSSNLNITGLTTTTYYRAKVAEYAANLSNADCITFSDEFPVIVTQAGSPPTTQCWEIATLNNSTCMWEVTGTQPTQPTIACYETATFNPVTCLWEVIGTQPTAPTGLACYETTVFNTTTCVWDITGTQPMQPTIACYETATFNPVTCLWEVIGTQPTAPIGLACYETTVFNTTTCIWDITGIQPTQPTITCYETATFNIVTCLWEVIGTQPTAPTGLDCWETAVFNTATCLWEVTGTQPTQPTIACYETVSFNTTTCVWDVIGTQPTAPIGLDCWETAIFNTTTCLWEVTGTQPIQPVIACWETAIFNNTLCDWEISGTQPIDSIEEDSFLCEGEDITLFANTTLVNPDFIWDSGEITDTIIVSIPGAYSVEITDGCSTTIINFQVTQIDKPVIETVRSNQSNIVVQTENTEDFLYSLDGIQYQSSNIFYHVENGLYTVYVKDTRGCDEQNFAHLHFNIQTFFTPNNDGVNDYLNLKGIENYNSSEVYIFDRYGKLIKSTKNSSFTWDGTFNNLQLPSADYWYIIILDGREIKGHFTLKR